MDHGEGPYDWLDRWRLRFYCDHTAGKGTLYLRGANDKSNFREIQRDAGAIRAGTDGPQPLDAHKLSEIQDLVEQRVARVKARSPNRIAYALDDEVSWGAFVVPIPWRIHGNDADYATWLKGYYGESDAPNPAYVTPDDMREQLNGAVRDIDLSPLLDRISYNDSVWAEFLGALVEAANEVDPDVPSGIVGAQSPNMWGGYDYAKLAPKLQFVEAYDLGSAPEILRSLRPEIPQVATHFHSDDRSVAHDRWKAWHHFAHGQRGMIGWVDEQWFEGVTPRPWLNAFAPTLKELGRTQGPKLVGAKWRHDGVAIYYSHPSIQVSWCLDSEAHGKTWPNRGDDHKLGTSHLVRKAWELMLNDAGLQYNFISYDSVVRHGIPEEYKVLILPACFALSDAEAHRIKAFADRGGTVIADFMPGLFDQHGRGRDHGVLDELFGVTTGGDETRRDYFADSLWVETDQEKGYGYRKYRDLFSTLSCTLIGGYGWASRNLPTQVVQETGTGKAVLANLSPQRYLQYRQEGLADAASREPFLTHVFAAGVTPRVELVVSGARPANTESTHWAKDGREYVFVVQNPSVTGDSFGAGGAEGLRDETVRLRMKFSTTVRDVINERTGEALGVGRDFEVEYRTTEAAFLSFDSEDPR